MRDINKIILVGRLGRDPEMKETKSGRALATFSLATSHRVKGGEGEEEFKEATQWHNLTTWGRQAEICKEHLRKGDLVYVEGSLRSRTYMGKDGNTRTVFDVYVDEISFLSKAGGPSRGRGEEAPEAEPETVAQAS